MQTATMNDVDAQTNVATEIENETDDLGKEEQKSRFIYLRAKGHSYARLAKELGIPKGTLVNWNTELEAEVAQARSVLACFTHWVLPLRMTETGLYGLHRLHTIKLQSTSHELLGKSGLS